MHLYFVLDSHLMIQLKVWIEVKAKGQELEVHIQNNKNGVKT